MFRLVILVLLLVPAIELAGIITVGTWIGALPTFVLILLTGAVGVWLARREGLRTWKLARIQLNQGELPGDTLLDGVLILVGGILLLTPGFFSDVFGVLFVLPYTRSIVRHLLKGWISRKLATGEWVWTERRR
ncbi:FxsA family protein [Staphylospora marina]|uniref:FxsA family protein n=1 Tax=Staphylospora marina TaxID=2490858 RepID=UPI000F5B9CEE|nr:FxsA family protein [Staphylospora marina]